MKSFECSSKAEKWISESILRVSVLAFRQQGQKVESCCYTSQPCLQLVIWPAVWLIVLTDHPRSLCSGSNEWNTCIWFFCYWVLMSRFHSCCSWLKLANTTCKSELISPHTHANVVTSSSNNLTAKMLTVNLQKHHVYLHWAVCMSIPSHHMKRRTSMLKLQS